MLYAAYPAIVIDGTVTASGCKTIDGTIVSEPIDAKHTQTVELCKFGGKNFRLVAKEGCLESIGQGTDPDTGKSYIFATPCDVPKLCDAPSTWGKVDRGFFYHDYMQVQAGGKQFTIETVSRGAICKIMEFSQEEKKISMIARGEIGTGASLTVTIPRELLDGDFTLIINGFNIGTPGNISKTEYTSTIALDLPFPEGQAKVDIIGTQVIPEFPTFGLIIFAAAISVILVIRLIPKLSIKTVC